MLQTGTHIIISGTKEAGTNAFQDGLHVLEEDELE